MSLDLEAINRRHAEYDAAANDPQSTTVHLARLAAMAADDVPGLLSAVESVSRLHRRLDGGRCMWCDERWPCPTIRALDGAR